MWHYFESEFKRFLSSQCYMNRSVENCRTGQYHLHVHLFFSSTLNCVVLNFQADSLHVYVKLRNVTYVIVDEGP
jgi:hypothetical protein